MALTDEPTCDSDITKSEDFLCSVLDDSIYIIVKDKPMIFYSYGHYGYSWSLIAQTDSCFRAFSGRVDYGGKRHISTPDETNQFDTTLLFSRNRALLYWGLDTIPTEVNKMERVNRKQYVTFYSDLSVINSDGSIVFSSDNAVAYSGPDSTEFNKKYDKLRLIMRWLSDPYIRQYIPVSAIY